MKILFTDPRLEDYRRKSRLFVALQKIVFLIQECGDGRTLRMRFDSWRANVNLSTSRFIQLIHDLEEDDVLSYAEDGTVALSAWMRGAEDDAEDLARKREADRIRKQNQRSREAQEGQQEGTSRVTSGVTVAGNGADKRVTESVTSAVTGPETLARGIEIESNESNDMDIYPSDRTNRTNERAPDPAVTASAPEPILLSLAQNDITPRRAAQLLEQYGEPRCREVLECLPFWKPNKPGAMIEDALKYPAKWPTPKEVQKRSQQAMPMLTVSPGGAGRNGATSPRARGTPPDPAIVAGSREKLAAIAAQEEEARRATLRKQAEDLDGEEERERARSALAHLAGPDGQAATA